MKTLPDYLDIVIEGMRKNSKIANDMVLIAFRMMYDGRC